jgi:succinoglycan biosynthesis protein ExoM
MLSRNESFREMLCAPIPRVLIAVCTHKRPIMLEACLSSLLGQETDYSFSHSIAVIDNDPAMSARDTVSIMALATRETIVHYLHEPKRGIARARNHALAFARKNGYTHLAFIDDDEIASPTWIKNLMHPDYLDTPILGGRKIMTYGPEIPEWARPKYNPKPPFGEGAFVGKVATSNMRIGPQLINCPITFDEAIGLGGGEDSDFVMRARKLNFKVQHTNRAITHETAHPQRMTIRGQANRTFWYAASNLRLDMRHKGSKWMGIKKIPSIIGTIPHGLLYGLLGACIWPVRPDRGKRTILKGAKLIAKGQGYLAALVGHIPQTYRHTVGG